MSKNPKGCHKSDIIFCGNPGTGKSTLLSCISGLKFESGVSFGHGLTTELKFQTNPADPNTRYADTPGLADIALAEKAAAAIHKALQDAAKKGRSVRIIFVVTTDAGRVRADDLMTMNKVMESIALKGGVKVEMNSHGVIVNKCILLKKKSFIERGKRMIQSVFKTQSEANRFPTCFIRFIPNIPELIAEDNKFYNFEGLKDFVNLVPSVTGIQSVSKIDTRNMATQIEAAKKAYQQRTKELQAVFEKKNAAEVKNLGRNWRGMNGGAAEKYRKSKQELMFKINAQHQEALERAESEGERKLQAMERTMQLDHSRQMRTMEGRAEKAEKDLQRAEDDLAEQKKAAIRKWLSERTATLKAEEPGREREIDEMANLWRPYFIKHWDRIPWIKDPLD